MGIFLRFWDDAIEGLDDIVPMYGYVDTKITMQICIIVVGGLCHIGCAYSSTIVCRIGRVLILLYRCLVVA